MKLVIKQVEENQHKVLVQEPTNRIIVVDVSGSMYNELPKLRAHLKNKLPSMVLPDDTLTIVWFSGKNQYGVLFEAMKLNNLQDIAKVNAAIDRYLNTVGMTAFVQPIEEVIALTKRLSGPCTMSFLTDGGDNAYSKKQILEVCAALGDVIASATFVEYGYYADHDLLVSMAEETGGSVVMAENFQSYQETLESNLTTNTSGKKIKVHKIKAEFVVGNQPNGFVIAKPDAVGTVTLPANTISYSYLEGAGDIESFTPSKDAAYTISALIQKGKADLALQIASLIGDETLYNQVQNSFSKQDYAASVDLANKIGSGAKSLYEDAPKNTNLVQDPDAYNVLTLLMDLASESGNYLHISHPEFSYSAIGSKRETVATEDGYTPVFTNKPGEIKAEIKTLKFDEDRPNISILTKREGSVNLPKNDLGFGDSFDTFIWRNYAIVKDGIVNVRKLPVILSKATHDLFTQLGVISEPFKVGKTYVIDTKKYPIINRSMTQVPYASKFFYHNFDLYKLRVAQKYLGSKIEKPEFSEKFSALYGEEGAKFLKECGITEGGFGPKSVKGEQLDPYMSKVLEVKLAGLNSIPKVSDVEKAIADKKKLTPSQQVMAGVMMCYNDQTDYSAELKVVKEQIKVVLDSIIKTKFGVIIGKVWFKDLVSFDDNTREMDFGLGKPIKCTLCLEDREV